MHVQEIMTRNPSCCDPETSLQEVARLMVVCDCGEIPVVDAERRPVGVVTDRDICCRAVAQGLDAATTTALEVMSTPVITLRPDDSLERCCDLMEEHQIRRVPVVDARGAVCGMVAQADIARHLSGGDTGEVVRDISRPAAPQGARPLV